MSNAKRINPPCSVLECSRNELHSTSQLGAMCSRS